MTTTELMLQMYEAFEYIMQEAAAASDCVAGYMDIDDSVADAVQDAADSARDIEKQITKIRDCLQSIGQMSGGASMTNT